MRDGRSSLPHTTWNEASICRNGWPCSTQAKSFSRRGGMNWMLKASGRTTLAVPALASDSGLASFMAPAFAVLAKDVRSELRARQAVSGSVVFGLLVVVIFNFAFDLEGEAGEAAGAGALWVAIVLAAMIGFNFIFAQEREQGGMEGLLLSSPDPSAIFFGKLAGALLFTLALGIVLFPAFALFAGLSLLSPGLPVVTLLGTIGFVTAGHLFSAMAVARRPRELLLPLLLLPVPPPAAPPRRRAGAHSGGRRDAGRHPGSAAGRPPSRHLDPGRLRCRLPRPQPAALSVRNGGDGIVSANVAGARGGPRAR